MGNITTVVDDAQRPLYFNNAVTLPVMDYTYDALYRLVKANGREQKGTASFGSTDNYNDSAWMGISHMGDDLNTQNYIQKYEYDKVGNITKLQHIADVGSYTRDYIYDSASNRLSSTEVGSSTYSYDHDNRGNIIEMPHLADMVYNSRNKLSSADLGGGGDAYYQYSSSGERQRKVIVNGAIVEERIYFGNYEVYRKFVSSSLTLERTTVHVADDTGRIAMLEVRTVGTDSAPGSLVRYVYSNHIGTSSLELDHGGAIISYEEYHPYGTTSYQARNSSINAVAKRYRFVNKERDDESGFYYMGARYYCPWLARWLAPDPINNEWYNMCKGVPQRSSERDFLEFTASSYEYCYANPIRFTDPTGEQAHVNLIKSLSNSQMVDALKIARDQVSSRLASKTPFEIGKSGSIKPLGSEIAKYAKEHHLSGQQVKDFHQTVNRDYIGLAEVAQFNKGDYDKLNRAVINNTKISDYDKLKITAGKMAESHASLWSFMGSSVDAAIFVSTAEILPSAKSSSVGPGLKGFYHQSTRGITQAGVKDVTAHLAQFNDPGNDIMVGRLNKIISGEIEATPVDVNFYKHELRESELVSGGMKLSDAHHQTLEEQGMSVNYSDKLLYTKEAIKASDDAFSREVMRR